MNNFVQGLGSIYECRVFCKKAGRDEFLIFRGGGARLEFLYRLSPKDV